MKTIYKYSFSTADEVEITMPLGAEILTVQTQNETPCIWALVDPGNEPGTRHFRIFGTGHPVNVDGFYHGTYQLHGGRLVFHIFEIGAP